MSDALSFAEIVGQHAELLPARTVLSTFTGGGGVDYDSNDKAGDAQAAISNHHNIVFGDPKVDATSSADANDELKDVGFEPADDVIDVDFNDKADVRDVGSTE